MDALTMDARSCFNRDVRWFVGQHLDKEMKSVSVEFQSKDARACITAIQHNGRQVSFTLFWDSSRLLNIYSFCREALATGENLYKLLWRISCNRDEGAET